MIRREPAMTLRRPIPLPDPPLTDGALALRPWRRGDGPALAAAWADPEVVRWTGVPPSADAAAAERWIAGEADRRARGIALDLVVELEGEVAGEVGLVNIDGQPGTAEIGWWVAPEHRGQGIAAAAAHLVAAWAVEELSVTAVVARCHPDNPASGRVAESDGFCRCEPEPGSASEAEVWRFG
jgi:RimJ/RimL family protein N-acetyltransferase